MSANEKPIELAGAIKFLIATTCLAVIWLVLLPRLALHPLVAEHIQQQQQQGIDPSAMYYSELDIMPAIAHHVERLQLLKLTLGERKPDRTHLPSSRETLPDGSSE